MLVDLERGEAVIHRLDAALDAALDRGDVAGDPDAEPLDLLCEVVDAVLALVGVAVEALDLASETPDCLADLVQLT
jgi:hypothetical protein